MRFLFGDYALDPIRRELSRGGEAIHVQPQVFDLLLHLVRNRDRVVSRDDLLATVWGGRIVSESTLNNRINAARHAIGDSGEEQHFIRTIARRGIRFTGEVRQYPIDSKRFAAAAGSPAIAGVTDERSTPSDQAATVSGGLYSAVTAGRVSELDSRPSVAVLPFTNMSGDPKQEYFSDGITEDIITELARNRALAVAARHASFTYRDKAVAVQQVGRDLRADYVVEGSIRRIGARVRVTVQLVDTATGNHVWAERYDRSMEDVFEIQDDITRTIVATVSDQIASATVMHAGRKPPANWRAYDYYLMGRRFFEEVPSASSLTQAIEFFQQAIAIDPQYARAFSALGTCHARMAIFVLKGDEDGWEKARRLHLDYGNRALALDSTDAEALMVLGWSYLWRRNFAEAERMLKRAYTLNPYDGHVAMVYVTALTYFGKPEQAIMLAEMTIRQNPHYPGYYLFDLADAYFVARRNGDAVALLDRLPDEQMSGKRAIVVAAYAHAGRLDDAHRHAQRYTEELRTTWKGDASAGLSEILRWEFEHFYLYSRHEDIGHLRDGLRKAGLPA